MYPIHRCVNMCLDRFLLHHNIDAHNKFALGSNGYTRTNIYAEYTLHSAYDEWNGRILLITPVFGFSCYYEQNSAACIVFYAYEILDEQIQQQVKLLTIILDLLKQNKCTNIYFLDGTSHVIAGHKYTPNYDYELYCFMKHGMTWYEKELGFQIECNYDAERYEIQKKLRGKHMYLQEKPLEYFTPSVSAEIQNQLHFTSPSYFKWVKHIDYTKPLSETSS